MRISDWSSDVCSSDLEVHMRKSGYILWTVAGLVLLAIVGFAVFAHESEMTPVARPDPASFDKKLIERGFVLANYGDCTRSEEHTSELQSLMRISYAVFCLKKKNTTALNRTATATRNYTDRC